MLRVPHAKLQDASSANSAPIAFLRCDAEHCAQRVSSIGKMCPIFLILYFSKTSPYAKTVVPALV
jgi:hypothetical protein